MKAASAKAINENVWRHNGIWREEGSISAAASIMKNAAAYENHQWRIISNINQQKINQYQRLVASMIMAYGNEMAAINGNTAYQAMAA